MPNYFTPRNMVLLAGAGGAAAVFLFPRTAAKISPIENFETPGVKNIGDRYSAGGGSTTHLPGIATPRGDAEKTISGQTGVKSSAFNDGHADQKIGEPNAIGKAWNQTHYGNDKGK